MGVRSIDYDNYDWELDDSPNNLAAVHTYGCGCCSRALLVNDKNLDEICHHLILSRKVVAEVFTHLNETSGLNWDDVMGRSNRFQEEVLRRLAENRRRISHTTKGA